MITSKELMWKNHTLLLHSDKDLEGFKEILSQAWEKYDIEIGIMSTTLKEEEKDTSVHKSTIVTPFVRKTITNKTTTNVIYDWSNVGVKYKNPNDGILCLRYKESGSTEWNILLEREHLIIHKGALIHRRQHSQY